MSLTRRLLVLLSRFAGRSNVAVGIAALDTQYEAVVRAHGDWLALLATILEREGIVSGDELARLLTEFAAVTAADRPAEGRILAIWASSLSGHPDNPDNVPSIH
jgi:hypothetical protein